MRVIQSRRDNFAESEAVVRPGCSILCLEQPASWAKRRAGLLGPSGDCAGVSLGSERRENLFSARLVCHGTPRQTKSLFDCADFVRRALDSKRRVAARGTFRLCRTESGKAGRKKTRHNDEIKGVGIILRAAGSPALSERRSEGDSDRKLRPLPLPTSDRGPGARLPPHARETPGI